MGVVRRLYFLIFSFLLRYNRRDLSGTSVPTLLAVRWWCLIVKF